MPRPSRAAVGVLCLALITLLGARAGAQEPLFVFAQMSDSQPDSAADNQAFVDVLRTIAEAGQAGSLLPRPVDLVLFAGDITEGNTRTEWIAAKAKLDTWLTANDIPFLAVPGNHDVNNSDTALYEEFIADSDVWDVGSTAFTGHNGRSRTTFWRGLRFIGFNNTNPAWNTISSADVADISARVDTAAAAQENVFLLCHHPHDEKERVPLAGVLPNPSIVGYMHGHQGSPFVRRGLAGISNPNVWEVDSNATYDDRALVYFEVFPTELRAHVLILDDNPTSLPPAVVIPLAHPLTLTSELAHGVAGALHTNARATPTSRSPERKLWFHDDRWWGVLWSDAAAAYRIQRLDLGTQTWIDTGPTVSSTAGRSFDALSEGNLLCVASNVTTVPGQAASGSPGQLHRFQYQEGPRLYTSEPGFPVAVNDSRSSTLVLARDTVGTLWCAWTRGGSVFVNHTLTDDAAWAVPITLTTGLASSDTVALSAFAGQVGALWSNTSTGSLHFATHVDGAPDEAWTSELITNQASLVGSALDLTAADGRALAAVGATDGSLNLFARAAPGTWIVHALGDSTDSLGEPLLVVDRFFDLLRLFATGPTLADQSISDGGAVYTKIAPLSLLDFPPGRGTPVLQDGTHPSMGFASSTRQDVDVTSGLLVLGSVAQTERYWHERDAFGSLPLAPVAEFSATPLSGPAPHLVAFTDLSSGTPTWWHWDFGDGTQSFEPEPHHVFAQAGVYTVSLRVANGGGDDLRTRTAYVDVGAPSPVQTFTPVADARVYESSPNSNYGVDSTLRVKAQAGSSFQTFLRFDVGTLSGSLASAKLRLFCTDSSNGAGSVYRIASNAWSETGITWNTRPALPASPLVSVGGVTAGFWVEFELGSAGISDGLVSLAVAGGTTNSVYYSSREGTNPPQLVLTYAGAGTPPVASFTGTPLSGPAPLSVSFTDTSTNAPNAWSWDFGDGNGSNARNPTHVYQTAGLYTVMLEASNGAGLGALTREEYVLVTDPPPVRTFLPAADARVSESNVTRNFGTESILRVKNQLGSTQQSFLRFDLSSLTGSVVSAKLRLFCTEAGTSGGRVTTAPNTWTELGINWNNRPALPGTTLATLATVLVNTWYEVDVSSVVTGPGQAVFALSGGNTNSVYYSSREGTNPPELVVETGANIPPTADFTATPLTGSAPLAVTFSDASVAATNWLWDFGDGTGDSTRNPTHVYTQPGTYSVTLFVSNVLGDDTLLRSDLITVVEPPPIRTFLPTADARVSESSVNSNYGTESTLRIKDQLGSSQQSFLRFDLTSLTGSVVSAKLRFFCTDAGTTGVRVTTAPDTWTELGINWNNRPALPGTTLATLAATLVNTWYEVDVSSVVTGPGQAVFALSGGNTNSVYYSSREGTNPPELVVETGGNIPPTADFSATPLTGSAPLAVTFSDASLAATSWSWDFGDGTGDSTRNPTHVYTQPGTYSVTLFVSNMLGNDTRIQSDLITVLPPSPVRTFLPIADGRANEASPNSSAGSDPVLRLRQAAGGSYHTYLRFDLASLTGTVVSAKLRLFSTDGSDVAGLVYPTSNAWTEASLNWANKPPPTGPLITSTGTVATGAWAEFDITSALGAPGLLDLVLQSSSSNSCYYSSREGANPPELVIETAF